MTTLQRIKFKFEEMKTLLHRGAILFLVLVLWQSLSETAEGQITTALPPPTSSRSDAAKIASSTVPASFVGLALLILSTVLILFFFKRRKCKRLRRYDISHIYISEVAQEPKDTPADDHGIRLISYKKLSTDSEGCTTELEEEEESNDKGNTNQLQPEKASAHPHGVHSYDLLACNV